MARLILLLLLPVGAYGYWKYFLGQPEDVRQQRTRYLVFVSALALFFGIGVKTGSWAGAAVATFSLLVLTALPGAVKRVFQRAQKSREPGAEEADAGQAKQRKAPEQMTEQEACEILGVEAGASHDKIVERYQRLIKVNHPDHGGSDYLARRILAAKELLMKKQRRH